MHTSLRPMITRRLGAAAISPLGRQRRSRATQVLLVGDVRLFRELLQSAVEDEDDLEVVGTASVDVAAMAGRMFEPDIVVADSVSLTIPDGIHALASALPDAKIVVIGVPDDEDSLVGLLEAGATGYVTAEQPFTDLLTAVEAASNGELACPPRLSAALARRIAVLAADSKPEPGNGPLTPRQREIAALIAAGLSNKQIARRLLIEPATVKNHVHTILVKLGLSGRDQVGARLTLL